MLKNVLLTFPAFLVYAHIYYKQDFDTFRTVFLAFQYLLGGVDEHVEFLFATNSLSSSACMNSTV